MNCAAAAAYPDFVRIILFSGSGFRRKVKEKPLRGRPPTSTVMQIYLHEQNTKFAAGPQSREAHMSRLNRFEWLKAVLQCADLNSSTKVVASALSVQFANDRTGQLNPSLKTLDEFLVGMSLATIKRCLKQLVEFGWLFRTEGRGAGNHTEYDLRSPTKIIPFRRRKKDAPMSLSEGRKGSPVRDKGRMGDLSYIKKEQSIEQNLALEPDLPNGGPSDSARVGSAQPEFVSRQSFGCRQWEQFTERMFGAWIDRVLPEAIENNERGYWLPGRFPPTNKNEWPVLRSWLITEGWTLFAPSKQELCHAV
ncbi:MULTISPECIES: hypothetical protein [Ruegeria]|uniref:hypothetical protein n=1 Tax=Ruegeria TaxID=97050 RepID=UPI00071C64B0|nr:hypothetical protein [Ruegeria denitrificans]